MRDNKSRRATVTLLRLGLQLSLLLCLLLCLLLGVAGCNDETAGTAPVASAAPTPSVKVVSSGPLSKLEAPKVALAYGGSDDPGQLASALRLFSGKEEKASERLRTTAETLAKKYKITDPKVLALDKPLRVAALDPKTFTDPLVLVVGSSGHAAVAKALPPDAKPDGKGNAYSYALSESRNAYINFVGDYVVFSGDEDVFPKHHDFIAKLVGASLPAELTVVVRVDRLSALYKKEIDNAVGRANKRARKAAGAGITANATMGKLLSWTGGVIPEVKRVQLRLATTKASTRVSFDIDANANTDLAKTFASLGARKLDILTRLPRDATAAMAIDMDPDTDSELAQTMATWLLQLSPLAFGADKPNDKYAGAMQAFWKATDGQLGFAVHHVDDALAYSSIFGVRDASGAREAMGKARAMYQEEEVARRYKRLGMAISYEPKAYRVKGVAVDRVNAKAIEPAGGGGALGLRQAFGGRANAFVDLMNSHLAIRDEMGLMSYGKEGRPVIEAWLSDGIEVGMDSHIDIARLRKTATKGTFAIGWGLPSRLLAELSAGAESSDKEPADASDKPAGGGAGVGLTVGAAEGALQLTIELPANEGKALVKLLSDLRRAL